MQHRSRKARPEPLIPRIFCHRAGPAFPAPSCWLHPAAAGAKFRGRSCRFPEAPSARERRSQAVPLPGSPARDRGVSSHGQRNNGTNTAGCCGNTTKDGFSGSQGAPPSPGKSDPGTDLPGKAFQRVKAAPSSSSSIITPLHPLPYPSSPQMENPARAGSPRPGASPGGFLGRPRGFIPVGHRGGVCRPGSSQRDQEGSQWDREWPRCDLPASFC